MLNKGTGMIMPDKDPRDIKYSKVFGATIKRSVPDFRVAEPLEIKDQGSSDCCVAFALSSVSEDQEGVILEPAYLFAKTKQLMGDWKTWGADPKAALKAICKYGSLEKSVSPYSLENSRNFIANWNNWNKDLDIAAAIHRKKSFLYIDESSDKFNHIISTMYDCLAEKKSVLSGIYWQPEWTYAENGICSHFGPERSLPHAIKLLGKKTINGVEYIEVLNSWGEAVGDKGIYYFSEEVVNNLAFAYMVFDLNPEELKQQTWTIYQKLYNMVMEILKLFKEKEQLPKPLSQEEIIMPKPTMNKLTEFADAIQEHEGWYLPGAVVDGKKYPYGSVSFRNNNPGNLRGWTAYTRGLGAIAVDSGNFCKFTNEQKGKEALCQFISDAANDLLIGRRDLSILDFFQGVKQKDGKYKYGYAPKEDNNDPVSYASVVASKVECNINDKLKDII